MRSRLQKRGSGYLRMGHMLNFTCLPVELDDGSEVDFAATDRNDFFTD